MVAPRQLAPAVAQREQRVELLDELRRGGLPAQRPDRDAVAGRRLARDLEDRERDVEPAAQVDVAVGRLLELLVARRLERLDQPVLEHERSELGVRGLVVDVLGLARPLPRRREVRPRARPQADRLADVQRAPVGVAEDVDARVLRELRHVGAQVDRRGAPASTSACAPRAAAAAAPAPRRSSPRARTASGTARRTRARTSPRRAARGAPRRPRSRARRPARPARGGAAAARAGARARPCTAPAAPATRARRARTPAAARGCRSARCGRRARAPSAARRSPAAPHSAAARRRPSPARCR